MDPALGPPEKMAERADELTPMMSQYYELCRRYDDCLVLFQVGDFYEAFCDAAEVVARLLEVTLTQREDSTGTYAMAGIPIDNAESYVETLLDAGYRVAIADQVQDPDEVTGVVDRAVTRVITPGTLTEDELLADDANNFVACLTAASQAWPDEEGAAGLHAYARGTDREYGLALLDVSTGDFVATSADSLDTLADEVGRFAPPEAITDLDGRYSAEQSDGESDAGGNDGGSAPDVDLDDVLGENCMRSPVHPEAFDRERAERKVAAYFGDPDALLAGPAEVKACGALLSYAEYARGGVIDGTQASGDDGDADEGDRPLGPERLPPADEARLEYINRLTRYDPREYMLLDAVAMRSLELFERRTVHGDEDATLAGVVDDTETAMGGRRLTEWLRRPLLDPERIRRRHDAVEALVEDVATREAVRDLLRDVYDVERLISRVSRGRADARDLRSLKASLDVVPEIAAELDGVDQGALGTIRSELDPLEDVRSLIDDAIREDPPVEITEGGVIEEGYHDRLDELRATEREGKAWIDQLEDEERERTGIDSLKVGHNAVHGYYIEVTDPNLDRVPEEYQRRQTLKNAERFVTPELKEREEEIVRAEGRADDLEYELFREVRSSVADEAERIQAVADALARLDALASFAAVAAAYDYARPEIVDERRIEIEAGRHPTVERRQDSFVPNDARLTPEGRFVVITGPNMSGKSTYMRQTALIVLLAQAGAFVPARTATIGPVERIFTRVGASDDIAGGRSTFMVEMLELAEILRGADERSLVLLDEVGRGTSTADGLALARAIAEHVHDELGAFTLFATHHHDLTATAAELPAAVNRHFEADGRGEEVVFDHEIAPGPATASYGVEVAGEAGVPEAVVDRAREHLKSAGPDVDGATDTDADGARDSDTAPSEGAAGEPDAGDLTAADDPAPESPPDAATATDGRGTADEAAILDALRETDVATLTPLEALNRLAELKDRIETERRS